jgi:hypothetical protein
MNKGWAEPWFENPLKPDMLVCKLTDDGRKAITDSLPIRFRRNRPNDASLDTLRSRVHHRAISEGPA